MPRLDINNKNVFNRWRELYDDLSDAEQLQFCNELADKYPSQKAFKKENYNWLFARFPNRSVYEVGGWKGELAKYCLENHPIADWLNFEFCQKAADQSVVDDPRFRVVVPHKFRWFKDSIKIVPDIFLSSHMIEHLSDDDCMALLDHFRGTPIILLEAPIKPEGQTWNNFLGTHKLNMGWDEIEMVLGLWGYRIEVRSEDTRLFLLEKGAA